MEDLNKADHAMKDNADMVGKLHNRKLCTVFENGILFSTGRLENMMKQANFFNKNSTFSIYYVEIIIPFK